MAFEILYISIIRCLKDVFTRLGAEPNPVYDKLFEKTESVLKECDDIDFIK